MIAPRVSVVIPVYNCAATVGRALESVFAQTLDPDEIEIVAVDDGSTDGSGALLDEMAASRSRMSVVHQANSGGPGGPRNAGLAKACGEYVFFLDADDWLGAEALARMCAMADENGTDVVLGKYVGVGRAVPERVFRANAPYTTLAEPVPNVYGTLAAMKLFRRKLLVEQGLRFPEGVLSGEDQIFTAHAYLHASGVSVVADHDCYFWVGRADGSSIMQRGGAPAEDYFAQITELFELVERHTEPGELRDRLLARHVEWDVLQHRFDTRYLDSDEEHQRANEAGAKPLLDKWLTPEVMALLPPHIRVAAHCLRAGLRQELRAVIDFVHRGPAPAPMVIKEDRAYLAYPYFGGFPDECYDYTDRLAQSLHPTALAWAGADLLLRGETFIWRAPTEFQKVNLVLRSASAASTELRFAAESLDSPELTENRYRYPRAGFEARIPVDSLPPGRWDPFVEIAVASIVKIRRLGEVTAPEPRIEPGRPSVVPYLTGAGNLRLSVGALAVAEVTWAGRDRLRVRARISGSQVQAVRCELRRRETDEVLPGEAVLGPDGECVLEAGLGQAGLGLWDLCCEVGSEWHRVAAPGPMPAPSAVSAIRRAEPYRTANGMLTVRMARPKTIRRVRSMLRRLRL